MDPSIFVPRNGETISPTELQKLRDAIEDWNNSRLDLFEISKPTENGEFHGVMRFFFQEAGAKVATKCIRVSSTATTKEVNEALIEKFHPDMRMLSSPKYALYEIHAAGDERKLGEKENPLLVQLHWTESDREGRFLLKVEDANKDAFDSGASRNSKRRLSRREKKELKKKEKELKKKQATVPPGGNANDQIEQQGGFANENVLKPGESPLDAQMKHPPNQGELVFELKNRPDDHPMSKKMVDNDNYESRSSIPQDRLPYFLELNPDGTDVIDYKPKRHRLQMDVTEVGSERSVSSTGNYLQLFSQHILPRHCVIANMEGVITVTPTSRDAETYVNNQRIFETTIIQNGAVIQFGKMHTFRFCDPLWEDQHYHSNWRIYQDRRSDGAPRSPTRPVETTFDVDGNIETTRQQQMARGQQDIHPPVPIPRQIDEGLPAILEFRENAEDAFLEAIIANVNASAMPFKLSPTYNVYMALRYRLSRLYRPEMGPTERAQKLTALLNKMADLVERTVQDSFNVAGLLAFWLANSSEILNFVRHDKDMGGLSQDAQDILSGAVQESFKLLVKCLHDELNTVMNAFLDPSEEADVERDGSTDDDMRSTDSWGRSGGRFQGRGNYGPMPTMVDVVQTLASAMTLIRRCRVNAALTIQFFSQLFHYINMWLFNAMVMETQLRLCTRDWGKRIRRRLGRIEAWALKQGLELAAECHLSRVIQASNLLQSPKSTEDDIASISSKCFKLNSLQLRALLENYLPRQGERPLSQELIERIVRVAENTADDLTRNDGRPVQLIEDPDPMLPFLLPEDGYTCDIIRGIPNGLQDELAPLMQGGLCRLTPQLSSTGDWTIHLRRGGSDGGEYTNHGSIFRFNILSQNGPSSRSPRDEPEVITITFHKHNTPSMGLSIVAARGTHQNQSGIYIKSVVPGGAAQLDGRLEAGDQLLKVDGNSLCGLTQEKAAKFLVRTGKTVTLQVAKKAAEYHDLSTLLSQPSPVLQRAHKGERQPRPKSEDFLRAGRPHSPSQQWQNDQTYATDSLPRRHHASNFISAANKARSSPNLAEDPRTGTPPQHANTLRPQENDPYHRGRYAANTIERTNRGPSPASNLDKANKARSSPNLLVDQDQLPPNTGIYASVNKDRMRIGSSSSLRPQDQRMQGLQREAQMRSQSVSQLPGGDYMMGRPGPGGGGSTSSLQRPPQQRYPNYAEIPVQRDPRMQPPQRQDYYQHPEDRRQDYYQQEPHRVGHSPQQGDYIQGPGGGRYPSQQDLRGQNDPRYQPQGGYLGGYQPHQQQPYQFGLTQNPLHYSSNSRLNRPNDDYLAVAPGQQPPDQGNYQTQHAMEEDKKKAAMERYHERVAKQQREKSQGRPINARPIEAKRITDAAGPRQTNRAPGHKNAYAQKDIPPGKFQQAPKNAPKIQVPVRTTPLQSKPGNTNSLPRTQKPTVTNLDDRGFNPAVQELKQRHSYGSQPRQQDNESEREKRYEEEIERMRDAEIHDLSQIQYRSPEQNDRFEKLMLEREFERRLKNAEEYSDDEEMPPMARDQAVRERRLQELQMERMKEQQIEKEKQRRDEENQRLEEQRKQQQRAEQQRAEQQRAEQQRAEQQRAEQQRAEQQRAEQQRAEQQRAEQQRAEQQRAEQQRAEQQRAEQQRAEQQRAEHQRAENQRAEQHRFEDEKRQDDARVEHMLRQQEEEMRQRHERQRQEQARREAEIEKERERIERQMLIDEQRARYTERSQDRHQEPEPYQPKPYMPKLVDPDVLGGYMSNLGGGDGNSAGHPDRMNGNPEPVPHVPLAIPKPAVKPKPAIKPKPVVNDNNSNQNGGDDYGTPQNSQNLNTFKVGDTTPTVIGSQEVYRDPRAKILASKDPGSPKPEEPQKLSFQQKMVMFRKEAGERGTPKERPRSSKFEREFLAENPDL
ncbi:afadin-like isoform X2 [Antedon mediterranea]|uniref:afadin-like isoform X2 n=1 Tax=Antedon mediterranea TaxID=105859 RepID=UPI003AF58442